MAHYQKIGIRLFNIEWKFGNSSKKNKLTLTTYKHYVDGNEN